MKRNKRLENTECPKLGEDNCEKFMGCIGECDTHERFGYYCGYYPLDDEEEDYWKQGGGMPVRL